MLIILPTPLGNLGDLTFRAKESLESADLILAEDTRRTGNLLSSLQLRKPMWSLNDHNEQKKLPEIVRLLRENQCVILLSDAGMPLVSDPGFRVVRACIEENLPLTVLPGPSAVLTALAASGLPPYPFYFGGFLPVKSGRRERELTAALDRAITHIYFESPHRLEKTLAVLAAAESVVNVCVAREMTKKFEEFRRGSAPELLSHYRKFPPKGEITLVFHGAFSPAAPNFSEHEILHDEMQ